MKHGRSMFMGEMYLNPSNQPEQSLFREFENTLYNMKPVPTSKFKASEIPTQDSL